MRLSYVIKLLVISLGFSKVKPVYLQKNTAKVINQIILGQFSKKIDFEYNQFFFDSPLELLNLKFGLLLFVKSILNIQLYYQLADLLTK